MRKLMPLLWLSIVLIISYFLFVGKFDFTDSQAFGLIFLLIVVIIIIGWNSYAEHKSKVSFELHHINIVFYIEPILGLCGLSKQGIKKFFEVYKKLEKGDTIRNEKLRPNSSTFDRTLTENDISITSKLISKRGLNYSAIGLLDSGNYLMVNNDSKTIGGAFTTDISCIGRIDLVEGMAYTHIYICSVSEGYEVGLINLDDAEYSTMGGSRRVEVVFDKTKTNVFGIVPYSLVHHHPFTTRQLKKADKILKKYHLDNDYTSGVASKYFSFGYRLGN